MESVKPLGVVRGPKTLDGNFQRIFEENDHHVKGHGQNGKQNERLYSQITIGMLVSYKVGRSQS